MSDDDQIRRTLGQYSQLLDDGRFDEWADLFTDDARVELLGQVKEGRDAIVAYMRTVQPDGSRGLHMTSGPLIDVDGQRASATTDYLFVRPSADGLAVIAGGRYYDDLVHDGDRWRFARRRITLLSAPEGTAGG